MPWKKTLFSRKSVSFVLFTSSWLEQILLFLHVLVAMVPELELHMCGLELEVCFDLGHAANNAKNDSISTELWQHIPVTMSSSFSFPKILFNSETPRSDKHLISLYHITSESLL